MTRESIICRRIVAWDDDVAAWQQVVAAEHEHLIEAAEEQQDE